MAIQRGTRSNARHGKNYITDKAKSRLTECLKPHLQAGDNALNVDAVDVLFFQSVKSSIVCTCKRVDDTPTLNTNIPPTIDRPGSVVDEHLRISMADRPLFGFHEQPSEEDSTDATDFMDDDVDEDRTIPSSLSTTTHLLSEAVDCSVCYRTGFVPGLRPFGHNWDILSTHNISDIYGYHIDRSKTPSMFQRVDAREGFVDFELVVPLFFKGVRYCIKKNDQLLREVPLRLTDGSILTLSDLYDAAGDTIKVRISSVVEFTHVVVDFDLGSNPIKASLSQGSRTLDYASMDNYGSTQIILPAFLPIVSIGDIVCVPSRKQVFKITDMTYQRTASDVTLEWSVNARVMQPTEKLNSLNTLLPLY